MILSALVLAVAVQSPKIVGDWWQVAGKPDLGEAWNSPNHGPVDFSIWKAKDGTWQLWSCIRATRVGGTGRLFFGWEGASLTSKDWKPMGVKMLADPKFGETAGGLQAPHVVRDSKGVFWMAYGDWEHICLARSDDGKVFTRVLDSNGKTGRISEGQGCNTRDAMLIKVGKKWHCYYTAMPNDQGMVYCRTSSDFLNWSDAHVVAYGGSAGTNQWSSECPHVVQVSGGYLLFKTQIYGPGAITRIYRSSNPLYFGVNEDAKYLIGTLPVAAPEIIFDKGKTYIAALNPNLDGIRIAEIELEP
jgi:hypothetical protein